MSSDYRDYEVSAATDVTELLGPDFSMFEDAVAEDDDDEYDSEHAFSEDSDDTALNMSSEEEDEDEPGIPCEGSNSLGWDAAHPVIAPVDELMMPLYLGWEHHDDLDEDEDEEEEVDDEDIFYEDQTDGSDSQSSDTESEASEHRMVVVPLPWLPVVPPPPGWIASFAGIQKGFTWAAPYPLTKSLEEVECELEGLREAKRAIEREMAAAEERRSTVKAELSTREKQFYDDAAGLGLTEQLLDLYAAFCESIEPKFGSRGGTSIPCAADHGGSYVQYDPTLSLFHEHVEYPGPETLCNFRCEASAADRHWPVRTEYVVEFWPLPCPEPPSASIAPSPETWGELYPALYGLAAEATLKGLTAAKEMLATPPDRNASSRGGWLFEYAWEESLRDHPVKSKRWAYRSAHKIETPSEEDDVPVEHDMAGEANVVPPENQDQDQDQDQLVPKRESTNGDEHPEDELRAPKRESTSDDGRMEIDNYIDLTSDA
ncbi:hypothetical protein F4778DRAFT_753845 [Xylariomycetidae sp. FL2044]|nr:hypothetical protein F4778DRAFT_753845 [Xylariomycetidae sp. FL2044]